jgi:hypothetical protein
MAIGMIGDMQKDLATNGGVRPSADEHDDPATKLADLRAAIDGIKQQIAELEAAKAPADAIAPLKIELAALDARVTQAASAAQASAAAGGTPGGSDLPDLLAADASLASTLLVRIEAARKELAAAEAALAKDALKRVDLRLSRLLRRARLGRIEAVLGRKRALEVEIEAINNGILPQGAFDSLDAARYLQDNEEYWPFEGDDWPDEFVGTEGEK